MRIRVAGISIEEFILEVPLQIVYAPQGGGEGESASAIQEPPLYFTSTSVLGSEFQETEVSFSFCFGFCMCVPARLIHPEQNPEEDLPGYL